MKEKIIQELQKGKLRNIFAVTMKSLLDRQAEDGYFPESFTGRYEGAFTRSIGAYALFLTELGKYEQAKLTLENLFELIKHNQLNRMPHWYTQDASIIDMYDQIDGAAHCILAYASICLTNNELAFEEKYYSFAKKEIITYFSAPYFNDGNEDITAFGTDWEKYETIAEEVLSHALVFNKDALNLVRNFNFEHSREYHYWDCYDILTQGFVGAAADKMILLAKKRGDINLVEWLEKKVEAHRYGVAENLSFEEGTKKMYLEMRVYSEHNPDGVMFEALGWPNFSIMASKWTGCNQEMLDNTLEYLLKRTLFVDPVSRAKVNALEYMPDGQVFHEIFGKTAAWTIEYYLVKQNWEGIADWVKFICENAREGLITEKFSPVDANGNLLIDDRGMLLYKGDIPKGSRWGITDGGNGEQAVWFCRTMYHLSNELEVDISDILNI